VCAVFRDFKNLVELQLQHHITRVAWDNDKGERNNAACPSVLTEYSIIFEPSPPYTQDKNGVSERMIQTPNAKAHAMLLDFAISPSMWAESIYDVLDAILSYDSQPPTVASLAHVLTLYSC